MVLQVVLLCVFVLSQSTYAVVNDGKSVASSVTSSSSDNTNAASAATSHSTTLNTGETVNRRELPSGGLSNSYGVPVPDNSYGTPFETYGPPVRSNSDLPVPVYGVPNDNTNNVVYPALPPDIPPPLPSLQPINLGTSYNHLKPAYGPPLKLHAPHHHKVQFHKPIFSPAFNYGSFKIPKPSYGVPPSFFPKLKYTPLKPIYGPPKFSKSIIRHPLKLNFAPPKPQFVSSKPINGPIKFTGSFGSPLASYGPPHTTSLSPTYGVPHTTSLFPTYGLPHTTNLLPTYGPPQTRPLFSPQKPVTYESPKEVLHHPPPIPHFPQPAYGPPQAVHHEHHHHGASAPPTPPDIKYDGWKPIFGLTPHSPSNLYGAPQVSGHGNIGLTPPVHNDLSLTYASSFAHGTGSAVNTHTNFIQTPHDSYGAPLNTVTGSGGIVGSSGNDHSSSGYGSAGGSFGNFFGGQDSSLSVTKSIEYEIFPTGGNGGGEGASFDSYSSPPANSYAQDGPYAAAVTQGKDFSNSEQGLIPPSGLYGVPPGGQYGAPLLSPPKNIGLPSSSYGPPNQLNALEINPPKTPVVFRKPVPPGFLQSIGDSVIQKDANGIEHSQFTFNGQAYIPPPVPDITKHKNFVDTPTNLFSLPNTKSPTSFQSVVSNGELGSNSFNFGEDHNSKGPLTSYTAPLGVIDSSYGFPLQPQALTGGFDQSFDFPKQNFGGTFTYPVQQISQHQSLPVHDCSKSQHTSYGSASSYSDSISSQNTNNGGHLDYQIPSFNTDLHGVHSLSSPVSIQSDIQNNNIQGKALAQQYFGSGSDFLQSQELYIPNGAQNIPIQGNLGSYTLNIQSADGLNGQVSENIPHDQVLSEGLLQSILSAIEQPNQQQRLQQQQLQQQQLHEQQLQQQQHIHQEQLQQQQQQQLQQQHIHHEQLQQQQQQQLQQQQIHHEQLQQQQQQQQQHIHQEQLQQQQQPNFQNYGDHQHESAISYQEQNAQIFDGEGQHSEARQVVINPLDSKEENSTSTPNESSTSSIPESEQPVPLIQNNEIALYFNNNNENQEKQSEEPIDQNIANDDEARNGQHYGSFVSFNTPHSSFVYGDFKPSNDTQFNTEKTH